MERPIPGVRLSPATTIKWVTLDALDCASAKGVKFTKQDDGSLLASGPVPKNDTLTFAARPNLKKIVAIRLEVLPDDSLPGKGPGRAGDGNFVLSEVKVTSDGRAVVLQNPKVDYSQKDWPIAHALDDQKETGWAIAPQTGKPHSAVFEAKSPFDSQALTVTLEFESKIQQYVIGKFRISAACPVSDKSEKP